MFEPKKFIIGCEKSQTITMLLRAAGHIAYSCDLQEADIAPQWHIQDDIFKVIGGGVFGLGCGHISPAMHVFNGSKYLYE